MESLFVYGKFCTRKMLKKCRKFCNQVARVKSSENSEGGCVPGWDALRPTAAKRKEGQTSLCVRLF